MCGAKLYRTHVYRAQVYSPTIGVLDPIVQIPGVQDSGLQSKSRCIGPRYAGCSPDSRCIISSRCAANRGLSPREATGIPRRTHVSQDMCVPYPVDIGLEIPLL